MFLNPDENLSICFPSKEECPSICSNLVEICKSRDAVALQQFLSDRHNIPFINLCRNKYGEPLLYSACGKGYYEIVRILLEYGADPNICLNDGTTSLMIAVMKNNQGCVNLLLSRPELSINAMRNTGCTALMISAMYGYTTICEMLLLRGADVHMKSRDGFTALAYACISEKSSVNIVKLLIDARSNIYWRNRYGKNLVSVSFNRSVKNYLKMLGISDEDVCIIL